MSTDSIPSQQTTSKTDTIVQSADASDIVSFDVKVKGYLDGGKYKEVIELLRERETQVSLTEQQLRYLAHAYISEGKAQDALAILAQVKTSTAYGSRLEGWCHLNLGNWDEALLSFEKSLEQENDPRNYYGICLALLRDRCALGLNHDEHPRMLEILEVAVVQEGCFPECFGWLDDIRWINRFDSEANIQQHVEFVERALKLYPDNEHLKHNLSRWFIHKDNEKALSIIKPILEEANPSGTIYCRAIWLCEYLDKLEQALAYLEEAEEKGFVEAPGKDLYKGSLLLNLGRLDEALKAYDTVLLSEDEDCKFHALFGRSLIYLEKGNKYIALRSCTEAVNLWWSKVGTGDRLHDSLPWIWFWFTHSSYSRGDSLDYNGAKIISRVISSLDIDLNNLSNEFNVRLRYLQYLTQQREDMEGVLKPDIELLERVVELKPTRTGYYNLSGAHKETKNFIKALEAHLRYCIVSYKESKTFYVDFDLYDREYNRIELSKIAQKQALGMHKAVSNLLEEFNDPLIREAVFRPFYNAFWKDLLYAKKMHKEVREMTSKLLEQFPDDVGLLWDYAYCSHDTGHVNDAERAYRKVVNLSPEYSSALHNLALIVEKKGAIDEALELSNRAAATAPNDENTCNLNERLKKKAAGYQEAKEKWDALDYYKRKLLRTLTTMKGYKDHADLAAKAGTDVKYIDGHLRRLKEQHWIVEDGPNKYHLNEYVSLLAKLPEPPYMRSNKPTEPIDAWLDIPGEGKFELIKPLMGYKKDIERQLSKYPFAKNVFLMMKFREANKELGEFIIENLAAHGLRGVRADLNEWNITKNVYNPIAALYCCKYGIALFDEAEEQQAYSPNVAYELGIMHYQKKDCLILRHASLPSMPFDLVKDLYVTYTRELKVKEIVKHWIEQVVSRQ